jgi:AcrR family transcriptional regulator
MARSRSPQAHEKVLRAALDLFGERGIDATSMDAIAQHSGVSKATIYNHWPDKEALLMEVMIMIHGLDRQREDIDSGDLQRDLTTVLTRRPPDQFDEARMQMTPSLISYSALHPEFGKAWRHRVMDPPREGIKNILRRGIQRRLLPRSLDLDASVALLLGPLLYDHIFNKDARIKPPDIGPVAAEAFCRAFIGSARPAHKKK